MNLYQTGTQVGYGLYVAMACNGQLSILSSPQDAYASPQQRPVSSQSDARKSESIQLLFKGAYVGQIMLIPAHNPSTWKSAAWLFPYGGLDGDETEVQQD